MPNADGHRIISDAEGEIAWDDLDAAGYDGAAFYIEPGKAPSAAWVAEGARRGRILLPIDEHHGNGAASGAAEGHTHAAEAVGYLQRLGVPAGVKVANAEADVGDPTGAATDGYYDTYHADMAAAGWPEIVCYGSGEVGQRAKSRGACVAHWLTCSGGYRGSKALIDLIRAGKPSGVDLWQRCANEDHLVPVRKPSGGFYDLDTNIILNEGIGLWGMASQPSTDPEETEIMGAVQELESAITKAGQDTAAFIVRALPAKPLVVRTEDQRVWVLSAVGRWHVPDAETLSVLVFLGMVQTGPDGKPAPIHLSQIDGFPDLAPAQD